MRFVLNQLFMALCLLVACLSLQAALLPQAAMAYSYSENYFDPQVQYHRDLSQKVRVNKKINLNKASLNELKTLPGVDDNLALKLMRMRPIEGIRDFNRMQWVNPKEVQQLIQNLNGRVSF
ncbi:MAG: helix-hairpin-helix domain-containing protein [Vampirovibrionales bacterium]|nr:helix-hairpin-helix domain-containing protein [Vampirovibrionales bacterium]